ncbi:energy-coupling factor ABC transporter permease [Streptomyces yaizuensis]|uniref:Energy-coupling factor ABC transporter permease n=1 Tax=Streptomyces yaizuensis TaxID=2989713 RepID=A0ABQ5PA59_9ACTN|nr:energy-coupling factor ABC transporter permease [Streptomyces sp. YSPA8]GLF99462.1 energy-coupling factor ABC transporter permease [Streptomyces sp. YSPA8]
MHVPDGFINAPVSVAAGALAAVAVGVCLRGARAEAAEAPGGPGSGGPGSGSERLAPLAGLAAAFVFAAQMLNFPVAGGTSGHLLGGALAAILVGPYTGVLCLFVVLLTQALLFADGGLTALGVNVLIMGVVTVLTGYGLFRGLLAVLVRARAGTRRAVAVASFTAALVSVPASAAAFTLLYAVGGTTDIPLGTVLGAMVGVHVLIGIGEAAITMLTVGAVLAVRPDLVHGARGLARRPLTLRAPGEGPSPAPAARRPARSSRRFLSASLLTALVLAGGVSFYASASPDGLEKVAADHGMDEKAEEHATADWPLADYGVGDIGNARLSGGLAGVIGVGATAVAGVALLYPVARRRRERARHRAGSTRSTRSTRSTGSAGSAGSTGSAGPRGA